MYQLPIVIIGPMCSGKTSVAKVLAKTLTLPRYPLDSLRWYYYLKFGLDLSEDDVKKQGNFEDLLKFRKSYDLLVVEHALKEFRNGILEFGASHSYWEENGRLNKAKTLLSETRNIFLLLPTSNPKVNVSILNNRLAFRNKLPDLRILQSVNRKMIIGKSNFELAKHIIYTEGMSPDQIAETITLKLKQ